MKRTVLLQFTSLSTILLQYSEPPAVLCNIKYCNILAVKYILTKAWLYNPNGAAAGHCAVHAGRKQAGWEEQEG
jgi:hypothetical protein